MNGRFTSSTWKVRARFIASLLMLSLSACTGSDTPYDQGAALGKEHLEIMNSGNVTKAMEKKVETEAQEFSVVICRGT